LDAKKTIQLYFRSRINKADSGFSCCLESVSISTQMPPTLCDSPQPWYAHCAALDIATHISNLQDTTTHSSVCWPCTIFVKCTAIILRHRNKSSKQINLAPGSLFTTWHEKDAKQLMWLGARFASGLILLITYQKSS